MNGYVNVYIHTRDGEPVRGDTPNASKPYPKPNRKVATIFDPLAARNLPNAVQPAKSLPMTAPEAFAPAGWRIER